MSIRVLVVDDHAVVRSGLKLLLDGEEDIEAVGEAGNARDAVFQMRSLRPDEYLTVGARDNMQRDSLAPPDPFEEIVTILLRIKGSDLAAYHTGQIDRDEARRRIQIGEF